jgi:hypothetical protein
LQPQFEKVPKKKNTISFPCIDKTITETIFQVQLSTYVTSCNSLSYSIFLFPLEIKLTIYHKYFQDFPPLTVWSTNILYRYCKFSSSRNHMLRYRKQHFKCTLHIFTTHLVQTRHYNSRIIYSEIQLTDSKGVNK